MSWVYEHFIPYGRGVEVADPGAVRAARWKDMLVLRAPHQPVASMTTSDMEATPYQTMAGIWGEEALTLISCSTTGQLIDRVGRVEMHPFGRVPQQFGLPYMGMLPPVAPVYRSVREARGGPRGRGWIVVTPGVPIAARRIVCARGRAGAPQAPLLQISVGPAHSSDDPIEVDSESKEFTGGETEEETEDSDPEWHDTQDIMQAERAEQSAERVTLVSEEPLSQGHGEDESVAGRYVAPATGAAPQSAAASVAGADPIDPSWRPGDPKTADEWRDLIRRVCTDTLMIPMERTRAELSMDAGEPSAAGRHTDVFAPVWHVARMVSTLRTELAGYRTAERLMRSHSRGETAAAPRDPEPSVHSERRRSRSPRHGRAPSEGSRRD
ncbi:hypothetical protein KI387_044192 [Taxus chinensis]|uniref:Uncharacterized protein n=2 Tax=Taxus chinensis TaxID=29808 RepID=A0AA38FSZ5_TAXCH|nr:hypothetical protein KI387_044192 [Taxus chinensis]